MSRLALYTQSIIRISSCRTLQWATISTQSTFLLFLSRTCSWSVEVAAELRHLVIGCLVEAETLALNSSRDQFVKNTSATQTLQGWWLYQLIRAISLGCHGQASVRGDDWQSLLRWKLLQAWQRTHQVGLKDPDCGVHFFVPQLYDFPSYRIHKETQFL